MSEKFFEYCESTHGYMISPIYTKFPKSKPISGSYNLLPCRLVGLSWPQWLRMCRQNGANLMGKNSLYVVPYWKTPNKIFLDKINTRVAEISKGINFENLSY